MTDRQINVLHILWDGDLGGVQRYVHRIVTAEGWSEFRNSVCFCSSEGRLLNRTQLGKIDSDCLRIKQGWNWISARRELTRVMEKFHPSILHVHCDSPSISHQLPRLSEVGCIYMEHGDTISRTNRSWFTNYLWKRHGSRWDRIVTNSHYSKEDFARRFPWLEDRTVSVPLCLTLDVETEREIPDTPVVGYVGRLVHAKGIDLLLDAAKIVRETRSDVTFVLYGDGEDRAALETQASKNGLSECVRFMGFCEAPMQAMAQTSFIVVPSRIETFGLVALEAHRAGVPVVCFDGTGVREVVEHEKTGLIVPQGNVQALAEAILDLINNQDRSREFGNNAIRRARNVFGVDEHLEKLKAVYRDVLDHKRA